MLFAHQGGWDEALIVLAPMIVFFGLLFVANRRARLAEGAPDAADVRDVALKLVFWPVTVSVWAGKQVLRRLQNR